jgi:rRNA maturation endonuclease Nob1
MADYTWWCLHCKSTFNGRGTGKCPYCGHRLKRSDLVTDEDMAVRVEVKR